MYKPPFLIPFDSEVAAPPAYRESPVKEETGKGEEGGAGAFVVEVVAALDTPMEYTFSVPPGATPVVNVASKDPLPPIVIHDFTPGTPGERKTLSDRTTQNAAAINTFIALQRQLFQSGVARFHRGQASFNGLDVFYTNNGGMETIHYAEKNPVAPEGKPGTLRVQVIPDLIAVEFFPGAT